ncbi:MAG: ABC transporter substrate-binding protein [Clostridiales Family XIII bacterium]|jgi:oligogalacturonide transport system substrate-binding protein|nr:ABC transporter substrate-binding protein [Clostridiales Family XIII bacterium]
MKNMKKVIVALLALTMVGSLMVGCGAKKGSDSGSEKGGKAEIRFSWWGNDDRHKATQDMIDNFEAENPDITVKGEPSGFGDLEQKITTQIAGGTEADVMTLLYDWIPKFSSDGTGFYDLSKIEDLDLSTYDPEFLKFGQSNGIQNAVPLGKNVTGIYLNKSAFDRVGAEIPTTWDEYKEAAKKFPDGTFLVVCPTPRFAATLYLNQKTGLPEFDEKGELNYSEADYLEAMTWYKDLVDAKVFCSRQDYLENVGTEPVSIAQNKKFIEGGYVGVMEWTGGIASNEATLKEAGDELIVAPLPVIDGAKGAYTIAKPTMLLGIKKSEKNPEAAGKFLNDFCNGTKANEILGVTRGIPESTDAVAAVEAKGLITGAVKAGYEFAKEAEVINETPFYENGTLTAIYSQQMENVELGQSDLKTAAKELYNQTKDEAANLAVSYKLAK